jgi:hypothetical protein
VYEELVEGGITRFMALYQCETSPRVGPVRSARTTDPRVLLQFGPRSMLAYSGGQRAVVNDIGRTTLASYDETTGGVGADLSFCPSWLPDASMSVFAVPSLPTMSIAAV